VYVVIIQVRVYVKADNSALIMINVIKLNTVKLIIFMCLVLLYVYYVYFVYDFLNNNNNNWRPNHTSDISNSYFTT